MVGGATGDRFMGTRRDERLTYLLREPERRHRFGVTSLALGRSQLFTAGRDGTVRAWDVPSQFPSKPVYTDLAQVPYSDEATKTFDEHVDWVNDLLLVHGGERLVTCSSDTTVKVWNTAESRASLRTFVEHTDYVKALAPVPSNGVASASLDGRVLIWDLVNGRLRQECASESDEKGTKSSIYCLSGTSEGDCNILVAGSTDRTISVWDIRSGEKVVKLRGHSDSVRCLALKYDGTHMLSGGSDSTVKLWDLRQERCIRSFDSFAGDSVWAIAPDRDFDSFVSGGRDGTVWHISLSGEIASLVVAEVDPDKRSNMVLDLAPTPDRSAVWVSTTGSSVRLWPLPTSPSSFEGNGDARNRVEDESESAPTQSLMPAPVGDSGQRLPLHRICGLPGIVAHKIMNDRRHVLTCNAYSEFCIWDITRGKLLKSLGVFEGKDIDEVAKEHDIEISVPSWFQVDIRLGSLAIKLERSSVFNAELYAVDAGLEVDSEDTKVNIGEHVVRGLFAKWLERCTAPLSNRDSSDSSYTNGTQARNEDAAGSATPPQTVANRAKNIPPYEFPDYIPLIVTEGQSLVPNLKSTTGSLRTDHEDALPAWVVDLVRDGKAPPREPVKVCFTLQPVEGTKLPDLATTTLNAPRVLRARKVAAYIAKELKEGRNGVDFDLDESDIDILCNGQIIPPTMSLATVRQFRWRSPDDLHLRFKLKDEA